MTSAGIYEFAQHLPIVGRDLEIDALVQRLRFKTRPSAVESSAADLAAEHSHNAGPAMVGPATAIGAEPPAKLGDGDDDHPVVIGAKVLPEGSETAGQLGHLPPEAAALILMRVPAAEV